MLRRIITIGFLGLAACAANDGVSPERSDLVAAGFTETALVSGLHDPTAMALVPDGRILVCEQTGSLRVIKNGSLLGAPFVTVATSVQGESGLLGVTVDPQFPSRPYVYVYYTSATPTLHNRVSRFTASGDQAVAGSEVVLFDLDPLPNPFNHHGGALHFGPDGRLYVAVGENALGAPAQSMTSHKGKILRLAADGSIPTDNPFYATATGTYRAIWALGLRNPFTFAFQPGGTRMFINDVGENAWEEVDVGAPGANYGWPATEGTTSNPAYVSPLFVYPQGSGASAGCAITGGVFYNPATATFPAEYVGNYLFADFCSGWIRRLDPVTGAVLGQLASGLAEPVDLDVSAAGDLYVLSHGGVVTRISRSSGGAAPVITTQPSSQSVAPGQPATFSVAASGAPPLTYQWQRDEVNLTGATAATYTLAAAVADSGARFRAVVSNGSGAATSATATLTVTTNTAPVAVIDAPAAGSRYTAGGTYTFSGTASDAEDGVLPASAFTWRVDFHHDDHAHPFVLPVSGARGGSFTIPTAGEVSANVFYRIVLTVTDAGGSSVTVQRDLTPVTTVFTLRTSPPGLALTLGGQPVTDGAQITGVAGMVRAIGAPSPQSAPGGPYVFSSWSDGGAAVHDLVTPASATTYTATFVAAPAPPPTGELLANPSLETWTAAGPVGWTPRPTGGVTQVATGAHGGAACAQAATSTWGQGLQQVVVFGTPRPAGTVLTGRAWVRHVAGSTGRPVLQMVLTYADGAATEYLHRSVADYPGAAGTWLQQTQVVTTTHPVARVSFAVLNNSGASQTFQLDDLSLTVP